jgi:hypothetical protein
VAPKSTMMTGVSSAGRCAMAVTVPPSSWRPPRARRRAIRAPVLAQVLGLRPARVR